MYVGQVCKIGDDKTSGTCEACPTPVFAVEVECVRCHGRGCKGNPSCRGGSFILTSCARRFVPRGVWRMFNMVVENDRHGDLPIGGGVLDQTRAFLACRGFIHSELRAWEGQLKRTFLKE